MTLAQHIIDATKKMQAKKEFEKNFKSDLRQLRMWQSDMQRYLKLPDSDYKFSQLTNAISAIYSLYVSLDRHNQQYKTLNPEMQSYHKTLKPTT